MPCCRVDSAPLFAYSERVVRYHAYRAVKGVIKKLVRSCLEKLARKPAIQRILQEELDLSCLKRRPTPREQFGIFLVVLSYVISWPGVAFFGLLSVYLKQPLVLIIGGPLIYGISHLVFFAGAYIAGKNYTKTFIKWSLKKACEKMSAGQLLPADAAKVE